MTREQAYDEHISPLMRTIIAACKKHDVPVVAAFDLDDKADPESAGVLAVTVRGAGSWSPQLLQAAAILSPPESENVVDVTKADR